MFRSVSSAILWIGLRGGAAERAASLEAIAAALKDEHGRVLSAARRLGVAHRTLLSWARRDPEVAALVEAARAEARIELRNSA